MEIELELISTAGWIEAFVTFPSNLLKLVPITGETTYQDRAIIVYTNYEAYLEHVEGRHSEEGHCGDCTSFYKFCGATNLYDTVDPQIDAAIVATLFALALEENYEEFVITL